MSVSNLLVLVNDTWSPFTCKSENPLQSFLLLMNTLKDLNDSSRNKSSFGFIWDYTPTPFHVVWLWQNSNISRNGPLCIPNFLSPPPYHLECKPPTSQYPPFSRPPPHLKMFVRRKWKLNETIKKASETKDKVQGNNHPGGADGGGGWMTH